MAKIGCLKPFRGTGTTFNNTILEDGEIAFDTVEKRIYMGDGSHTIDYLTPFVSMYKPYFGYITDSSTEVYIKPNNGIFLIGISTQNGNSTVTDSITISLIYNNGIQDLRNIGGLNSENFSFTYTRYAETFTITNSVFFNYWEIFIIPLQYNLYVNFTITPHN